MFFKKRTDLQCYRVRVNRGPLPPWSVLEEKFGRGNVSEFFDGKHEWKRHSSRQGTKDVTADQVEMVAKYFTKEEIGAMGGLETENIIAWGLKNSLLPADEKETIAFVASGVYPKPIPGELQTSVYLAVGLGSFVLRGSKQEFALQGSKTSREACRGLWLGHGWDPGYLFLFVRK